MDRLEQDLKRALKRQEPPHGFYARIMARRSRQQAASRSWLAAPWPRSLASAALVLMMIGGTLTYRHERQVEGEAAKKQVLVALRIAGARMRVAQAKVQSLSDR